MNFEVTHDSSRERDHSGTTIRESPESGLDASESVRRGCPGAGLEKAAGGKRRPTIRHVRIQRETLRSRRPWDDTVFSCSYFGKINYSDCPLCSYSVMIRGEQACNKDSRLVKLRNRFKWNQCRIRLDNFHISLDFKTP